MQVVNKPFALTVKDDDGQETYKQYYVTVVEIKSYNDVIIGGKNYFDQPIKMI